MVSEEIALEFQQIVKEEYGKEITLAEAFEMMNGAVAYYDKLAEIAYREEEENENEKQPEQE